MFYTVEATVSTNFPSARSMSSVTKDENTLFIVGKQEISLLLYMIILTKGYRTSKQQDVYII